MANLVETLMGLVEPGLTVGTRADTARMQGQQAGQDRKRADLLARLQEERDADDRRRAQAMQDLQMENTRSIIDARGVPGGPGAPTYGTGLHEVIGPDGNPTFVQASSAGGVRPVEGYSPRPTTPPRAPNLDPLSPEGIEAGKTRATALAEVAAQTGSRDVRTPTESQEKSYIYSGFMNDALPVLDELSGQVNANAVSLALSPGVALAERVGGPGSVSGRITGEKEQRLLNAARQFTAGVLRKESGAAIRDDELRSTFERFIPLAGDSPELREQKLANRAAVTRMMNDMALPATEYYRRIKQMYPDSDIGPAPQGAPSPAAPTRTTLPPNLTQFLPPTTRKP